MPRYFWTWGLLLGSFVLMMALILTRQPLLIAFALAVVPAGPMLYYLHERGLFAIHGERVFPWFATIALSFLNDALVAGVLYPHSTVLTNPHFAITWLGDGAVSLFVFFGIVILLELIQPYSTPRWSGMPLWAVWAVTIILSNGAAFAAWRQWAMLVPWGAVGGGIVSLGMALFLGWRYPRRLSIVIAYYALNYVIIMISALLLVSGRS